MSEPKPGGTLKKRALTAVLLSAATLFLIWWGVVPFALQILVLAALGCQEYYDLVVRKGYKPCRRLGTLTILAALTSTALLGEEGLGATITCGFVLICLNSLFRSSRRASPLVDTALTMLGVVYLGWMFAHLLLIRRLDGGAGLVTLLIFASAWTDMGGYFVGKSLGRRLLWPSVSPKKTVEGALGSVAMAVVACYGVGWVLGIAPIHRVATALLVSISGQLGDLWESALKREVGIKDSGTAIAGHGGVLDRFDSLAFAAPLYYYYVLVFVQ